METWVKVRGYESLYEVSSYGQIRNRSGLRKPELTKNGYLRINKNNIRTDNRLENLQLTTNRHNCSKDRKGKTSKFTGVHFCSQMKMWKASIRVKSQSKHLGYFEDEEEAGLAYKKELEKETSQAILQS